MNTELFIARRILFGGAGNSTKPIIRIAMAAVALSMAVMIVAIAIAIGFKEQITDKVIGFGSNIQIKSFENNTSFNSTPVTYSDSLYNVLKATPGVKHVQTYAVKAGIIKTDTDIEGTILKGIDHRFNWDFFSKNLTSGSVFSTTDSAKNNAVLISKYTANKLKLKTGDNLYVYFIQDPPRVRKFKISGVYETGLEEFDKLFALCDIRHIQKLNDWNDNLVAGYEVTVNDFSQLENINTTINHEIGYNLGAKTVKERYPQIFDWLHLQDINVTIIITLMLLVAGFNMISALLIIILEHTNAIGILKSMGMQDFSIRKVFLYTASFITLKGMLWGNLIGIALCLFQLYFHPITLDQESYYISYVPINIDLLSILLLNLGSFVICALMMLVPSIIIAKITPIKAIRFN